MHSSFDWEKTVNEFPLGLCELFTQALDPDAPMVPVHSGQRREGKMNYFTIIDFMTSGETLEDIWRLQGQNYEKILKSVLFSALVLTL